MSKYLSFLYIAGHYGALVILGGIIVLTGLGWIIVYGSDATLPALLINTSSTNSINVAPALLTLPAVFAAILFTFVPSAKRLLQLELSHRSFRITMGDVREAFYLAFSADRTGIFRLTEQFDAVSERIRFLKNHPELQGKEPDILELAAQMSFETRELAARYSTADVERARAFIDARLVAVEQTEALITKIIQTKQRALEIQKRYTSVNSDTMAQLEKETAELEALLNPLGFVRRTETNIISIAATAS